MSSFGYYAFGASYGSSSQMLDAACTPHMHYYSDRKFHLKALLHIPSSLLASKRTVKSTGLTNKQSKSPYPQVRMSKPYVSVPTTNDHDLENSLEVQAYA